MVYSNQRRKMLGAFYTPQLLADYLASTMLSLSKQDDKKQYCVVDPATGDSSLLLAFYKQASKRKMGVLYFGIDIEDGAIQESKKKFANFQEKSNFVLTDALYPLNMETPQKGWDSLMHKYLPNGIDFIISNPPWGADKSKYKKLSDDFITAKGQFDIYDLFIETAINNLNINGYYGIIVPDSIFGAEHSLIRKFLLENTTIKKIIRIGEGFFDNVNIAVSLLIGVKVKSSKYSIQCSHLTDKHRKLVLANKMELSLAVEQNLIKVPAKVMVDNSNSFLTDLAAKDVDLINRLNKCLSVGEISVSHRGVELSKKGIVFRCSNCGKWFPEPKKNNEITCPHCKKIQLWDNVESCKIISDKASNNSIKFISGDTIYRYNTKSTLYLKKGYDGINYKTEQLYEGAKILVRKTGVGITAGIDYGGCYTNQVVYLLRTASHVNPLISNEVLLAVLNSRLITYYIIKIHGSNGWKSHAYLTQKDVASLPFPRLNIEDAEVKRQLEELTALVKQNAIGMSDSFPMEVDVKIERIVANLFGLNESHYDVIFKAIENVQQMIPYKRLLRIKIKDIFKDGI